MALETRSLIDELRSFDSDNYFDLDHPLLNHVVESFVKAARIRAIQAVSREAYFTAVESGSGDNIPPEIGVSAQRHHRFPYFRDCSTLYFQVKSTGKESMQWGLAARVYSGITYGLKEARDVHDWKNRALAGALTGAAVALTMDDHSHEHVM